MIIRYDVFILQQVSYILRAYKVCIWGTIAVLLI